MLCEVCGGTRADAASVVEYRWPAATAAAAERILGAVRIAATTLDAMFANGDLTPYQRDQTLHALRSLQRAERL